MHLSSWSVVRLLLLLCIGDSDGGGSGTGKSVEDIALLVPHVLNDRDNEGLKTEISFLISQQFLLLAAAAAPAAAPLQKLSRQSYLKQQHTYVRTMCLCM